MKNNCCTIFSLDVAGPTQPSPIPKNLDKGPASPNCTSKLKFTYYDSLREDFIFPRNTTLPLEKIYNKTCLKQVSETAGRPSQLRERERERERDRKKNFCQKFEFRAFAKGAGRKAPQKTQFWKNFFLILGGEGVCV